MIFACTLLGTSSSHLKTDGWKTIVSFWDGATWQVLYVSLLVSGMVLSRIIYGCQPKNNGKIPNHPFVHRVFHYFHHPFWGENPPIFWVGTYIYLSYQTLISWLEMVELGPMCGKNGHPKPSQLGWNKNSFHPKNSMQHAADYMKNNIV